MKNYTESKTWFDNHPCEDVRGWRWSILFENGDSSNSAQVFKNEKEAALSLKTQLEALNA